MKYVNYLLRATQDTKDEYVRLFKKLKINYIELPINDTGHINFMIACTALQRLRLTLLLGMKEEAEG